MWTVSPWGSWRWVGESADMRIVRGPTTQLPSCPVSRCLLLQPQRVTNPPCGTCLCLLAPEPRAWKPLLSSPAAGGGGHVRPLQRHPTARAHRRQCAPAPALCAPASLGVFSASMSQHAAAPLHPLSSPSFPRSGRGPHRGLQGYFLRDAQAHPLARARGSDSQ